MTDTTKQIEQERNKAVRAEAEQFARDNLQSCCAEVLEWQDTAMLKQGKVRALAAIYQASTQVSEGDELRVAEATIQREAMRFAAAATPSPVPADTAELPPLPAVCDGKEQVEFESWAKGEKYDMTTHPIHWLFMHPETNAARQGWKAALEYVSRAALASRPAPVAVVPEGMVLVPRQMTDAMRDAGNEIILSRDKLVRAWRAMLDAAPSQPVQSAQEGGKDSGCRMTGGICACRSGGSFGGCAKERAYCCTNEPAAAPSAAQAAGVDKLHSAILNLPCHVPDYVTHGDPRNAYQYGARDIRHAAAELVAAHFATTVTERSEGTATTECNERVTPSEGVTTPVGDWKTAAWQWLSSILRSESSTNDDLIAARRLRDKLPRPSEGVAAPVEQSKKLDLGWWPTAGEVIESLNTLGWRAHGDAQHEGIRKYWTDLTSLLHRVAAAPAQPSADQVRDAALEEIAKFDSMEGRIAMRALRTTATELSDGETASGEKGADRG